MADWGRRHRIPNVIRYEDRPIARLLNIKSILPTNKSTLYTQTIYRKTTEHKPRSGHPPAVLDVTRGCVSAAGSDVFTAARTTTTDGIGNGWSGLRHSRKPLPGAGTAVAPPSGQGRRLECGGTVR